MATPFQLTIDRSAKLSLAGQIHAALRDAIAEGRLAPDARLPSWRDLAAQLGVARGTVRVAYERLIDEQLVVAMGAAGTRVASRGPAPVAPDRPGGRGPLPDFFPEFGGAPAAFQMGVPAQDAFPATLWSRLMARGARSAAASPVTYPDPRGEPALRREIAGYLAIARGLRCHPDQVLVTAGSAGALGLAVHALALRGSQGWFEDPGFPVTRTALRLGGVATIPVPVDGEGIVVAEGIRRAPRAGLAVVTPGQQSPTGVTLSLARRQALLDWARTAGSWIFEDDYLGELQLAGRAAPALASLDRDGRVLHAGTFSKTISPAFRLGFLVVPPGMVETFGAVAATLGPAPAPAVQRAVTDFIAEGHYLRHLRRMKRLYAARRAAVAAAMTAAAPPGIAVHATGGLSVRLTLPDGTPDIEIAARALQAGLAPVPLSPWHVDRPQSAGLMLGITNADQRRLPADCARLAELIYSAAACR